MNWGKMDYDKIHELISLRLFYNEHYFGEQPDVEESYWHPMIEELTKDPSETISLFETLSKEEFFVAFEVIDEVIQNTQSHDLIDAVKRIGTEREVDEKILGAFIDQASCWFD